MFSLSFFKVKYLREVTPYFKKASPLSDLGWGAQDSAQKDGVKANWSETKTIPLRLCYLCRNLTMIDQEKRTLELHSPDGKGMCALKFPDPATCSDWFNAIHSNMMMLTQQAILEANQIIRSAPNQRQIRHMGWLSEQVRGLENVLNLICLPLVLGCSSVLVTECECGENQSKFKTSLKKSKVK